MLSTEALSRNPVGSPTCVVVDDQPSVHYLISAYFAIWGIDVVDVAADVEEAVAVVEEHQPDALVLGLDLPGTEALELIVLCGDASPHTGIVVYPAHANPSTIARAVRSGARGFVSRDAPLDELARAVEAAAVGESYIDPRMTDVMREAAASARREWGAR